MAEFFFSKDQSLCVLLIYQSWTGIKIGTSNTSVGCIISGVMVIVLGNGHGDTSSNPGPDWLHFT